MPSVFHSSGFIRLLFACIAFALTACQMPDTLGANLFKITYSRGLADSGQPPLEAQWYAPGSDVRILLNSNNLGRTGYTFAGWTVSPTGEGELLTPGQTLAGVTSAFTLFPAWTANTYLVHFDPVGGQGSMTDQAVTYAATTALSSNLFTRVGYEFSGWNTHAAYSGTAYADGASFVIGASDLVLYAKWTPLTNTVSFNANGGSGSMEDQFIPTATTNYLLPNTFVRAGYQFVGWNTESLGKGEAFANNVLFVMGTSSLTLYAQWSATTSAITFSANGGTGVMTSMSAATDTSVILPPASFEKWGQSFSGWALSYDGPVVYGDGATITMGPTPVTLFARWTPAIYQISFDANFAAGTMSKQAAAFFSTVSLSPNTFARPGFSFSHWATERDGSGSEFADQGSFFVNMASDRTLYAQWSVSTVDWVAAGQGGKDSSWFSSIAAGPQGTVYAAGSLPGVNPVSFGNGVSLSGISSYYLTNSLLVKYDSQGKAAWARTIVSGSSQYYSSELVGVSVDQDEKTVTFGQVSGAGVIDFGSGVTVTLDPYANYTGVIVRYNNSGEVLWARAESPWSTTGYLAGTTDSSNKVYAVGYVEPGFGDARRGLLVVYDALGNRLIRKAVVSGPSAATLSGVRIDADGNIIVSGTISGTGSYDFGNGVHLSGLNTDSSPFNEFPFVAKLDSTGTALWARNLLQEFRSNSIGGVAVDTSGNIFVAGSVRGKGSFELGNGVKLIGGNDETSPFVVKLSSSGTALWAASGFSESGYYRGEFSSISIDASGNILAAGSKSGSLYFGNGITCPSSASGEVPLLVKFDPSGQALWAQTPLSGWEQGNERKFDAISIGSSNQIYGAGTIIGGESLDWGSSVIVASTAEAEVKAPFVAKFH